MCLQRAESCRSFLQRKVKHSTVTIFYHIRTASLGSLFVFWYHVLNSLASTDCSQLEVLRFSLYKIWIRPSAQVEMWCVILDVEFVLRQSSLRLNSEPKRAPVCNSFRKENQKKANHFIQIVIYYIIYIIWYIIFFSLFCSCNLCNLSCHLSAPFLLLMTLVTTNFLPFTF